MHTPRTGVISTAHVESLLLADWKANLTAHAPDKGMKIFKIIKIFYLRVYSKDTRSMVYKKHLKIPHKVVPNFFKKISI